MQMHKLSGIVSHTCDTSEDLKRVAIQYAEVVVAACDVKVGPGASHMSNAPNMTSTAPAVRRCFVCLSMTVSSCLSMYRCAGIH